MDRELPPENIIESIASTDVDMMDQRERDRLDPTKGRNPQGPHHAHYTTGQKKKMERKLRERMYARGLSDKR